MHLETRRDFVCAAIALSAFALPVLADDGTLDHATIDFTPSKGDDKDDDTLVSVSVAARINNQ